MAVDQVQRMAKEAGILQVGARNMQNFDLLRELGKVDRPPSTSSRRATSR
jgi:3-deoxy-7-phosphoheptulonate synthase